MNEEDECEEGSCLSAAHVVEECRGDSAQTNLLVQYDEGVV